MKPIDALWKSYALNVIPPDAPKVQITECKRAFFAGAQGVFRHLFDLGNPGTAFTDVDKEILGAMKRELDQFGSDVAGGKA